MASRRRRPWPRRAQGRRRARRRGRPLRRRGGRGASPALALVDAGASGVADVPRPSLRRDAPMHAVDVRRRDPASPGRLGGDAVSPDRDRRAAGRRRVRGRGGRLLDDAREYAAERRQFGRTIGSYQALRHILADMYVRQRQRVVDGALRGRRARRRPAATPQRTAAIAKAYVARAAREVAHGAMQVFGGIAFTQEHPAHRFLRRIVVREQQFGDADPPRARAAAVPSRSAAVASRCDDARDRLQRPDRAAPRADHDRRRPGGRRPAARRRAARPALA